MYNDSNKCVCTTTYKTSLFLPVVNCLLSATVVLWESNIKPHILQTHWKNNWTNLMKFYMRIYAGRCVSHLYEGHFTYWSRKIAPLTCLWHFSKPRVMLFVSFSKFYTMLKEQQEIMWRFSGQIEGKSFVMMNLTYFLSMKASRGKLAHLTIHNRMDTSNETT